MISHCVLYRAYNHFRFLVLEKEKNAKLIREVKVAKEETTQIRANTQQIISTYQVHNFKAIVLGYTKS